MTMNAPCESMCSVLLEMSGIKSSKTSGIRFAAMLPSSFLTKLGGGNTPSSPSGPAWEHEKKEILERSEYLARKVLVSPIQLLSSMPGVLGKHYGGQWAIYSSSMYVYALSNIARLYPEQLIMCLDRMEKAIDIILSPELRQYDTVSWKEDALQSLSGEKSHLSYLSLLAWSISEYKLTGGVSSKYDNIFLQCCEALDRRMRRTRDFNIPTFANKVIFIPDMIPAIISLRNFTRLYDDRYESTIAGWKKMIKSRWIHPETGLIKAKSGRMSDPRGSYAALTCSYLSIVDENFAREQYNLMKSCLVEKRTIMGKTITGVKEYLSYSPSFKLDPDAGPIVKGLSGSGTAFALGAATRLGDWEFRHDALASADVAACTRYGDGECHYELSEMALVGEAVALAMRTNVPI